MEEDPPVRFKKAGKVKSMTENGESFQITRLKVSNEETYVDMYLFEDGGKVMIRNHSNNRVMMFTKE